MDVVELPTLALLGVALGVLFWRAALRERREYAQFKRLRSTALRQKTYRRWMIEAIVSLGGLSVATIVGGWASIGPLLAAAQTWPPVASVRAALAEPWGVPAAIGVGLVLLAVLFAPILALRGTPIDEAPALGDIRALLPRTRGELPYGVGLSLNAGVSEELLFRLGLPALVYALTGDPLLAFGAAAVVFALLHVYQGVVGILFSGLLGLIFTYLYLVTGSILVPIVLHALIDLRSMVLIPIVLGSASTPGAPARPVRS
jgi:membrane protease YdiL (CAAX protease family)